MAQQSDLITRHAEAMDRALADEVRLSQRLRELTGVSIGPFRPSLDQMEELVSWCEGIADRTKLGREAADYGAAHGRDAQDTLDAVLSALG